MTKRSFLCAAGFTLVELLIVIVILAVLASVAVPRFAQQKEKAYIAEAVNIMGAIRQGEQAYRLEHTGYIELPGSGLEKGWGEIGLNDPNADTKARFTYCVKDVSSEDATIEAKRKDGDFKGLWFTLSVRTGEWDRNPAYGLAPED